MPKAYSSFCHAACQQYTSVGDGLAIAAGAGQATSTTSKEVPAIARASQSILLSWALGATLPGGGGGGRLRRRGPQYTGAGRGTGGDFGGRTGDRHAGLGDPRPDGLGIARRLRSSGPAVERIGGRGSRRGTVDHLRGPAPPGWLFPGPGSRGAGERSVGRTGGDGPSPGNPPGAGAGWPVIIPAGRGQWHLVPPGRVDHRRASGRRRTPGRGQL